MIRINEIFGPTVQGEGPSTGQHCLFIRVARCNLHCWFCDTPYTWATTDAKAQNHREGHVYSREDEEREMDVDEILDELKSLWDIEKNPTLIVISGGEPMLQQKELTPLVQRLLDFDCDVEIETAGTITPIDTRPRLGWDVWAQVNFNCSPKLENSKNPLKLRRNVSTLNDLAGRGAAFKFVVEKLEDFAEIEEIVDLVKLDKGQIYIMPEGTTSDEIRQHSQAVINEVLRRGWNFSQRVHVTIWGAERGK